MSIIRILQDHLAAHPESAARPVTAESSAPLVPNASRWEPDVITINGRPFYRGHLTGRCADGAERDSGTLRHLLSVNEHGSLSYTALCGAKPGRRSAGWNVLPVRGRTWKECARCEKRAEKKKTEGAS